MVIGLGTRLEHKQNRKLTSRQCAHVQLAWTLHVVVGKAYENNVGKGLHSALYL